MDQRVCRRAFCHARGAAAHAARLVRLAGRGGVPAGPGCRGTDQRNLYPDGRRRRRRAAGKAAEAAAQENAKREERGERAERPERNERPAEKAEKQPAKQASSSREKAQSGRGQQRSAARPEHNRQTQRTSGRSQQQKSARAEKQPRQAAPAKDEDPGLLLISRKPPAQKFASFEEYMKSHGGFSEPIEGEAEE